MTYVMSDIHGNLEQFNSILKQIELKPEDTLYIAGDVIDRHPDGIKILKKIMKMPNAKMLLGNHEYMMINAIYPGTLPWEYYRSSDDISIWYRNGGGVTNYAFKKQKNEDKQKIFEYLLFLPTHYDLEIDGQKWQIVHSAPEDCMTWRDWMKYSSKLEFSVWKRNFDFDLIPDGRKVIFGHMPTYLYRSDQSGPLSIWRCPNGKVIGIDCGSGFPNPGDAQDFPYVGRLACLRLEDMKEFYGR